VSDVWQCGTRRGAECASIARAEAEARMRPHAVRAPRRLDPPIDARSTPECYGSQGASQQPQAHCARRTDRRACQGHMRGKDSTHCPVSPTHSCALTSHPLSCRLRLEAGPRSMVATLLDILGHISEHVSRSLVPRLWSTWEHMDIDMPCGNC